MMSHVAKLWFPPLALLVALVPLGAQSPLPFNLLLLLVSAGYCVAAARDFASRRAADGDAGVFAYGGAPLLLALPAYVVVQFVAQILLGYSEGPAYMISQSALVLVSLALFYVLVRAGCTDARAFRTLIGALALIGGAEAAYGVLNLLAGNETLLIWKRWIFFDSATGTLSSRNHFGYLMELLLPVAIAFAVVCGRMTGRRRNVDPSERRARTALIGTIAVVCALGLFFSHSRMGILSFALAAGAVFTLDRAVRPSHHDPVHNDGRSLPVLAIGLVVLVIGLSAAIGMDSVLERFLRVDNDFVSGRWPIWKGALGMFADHPIVGNGWGTFQALLPSYRLQPNGFYYTHAHNEYLEVLAEGGLVGVSLVLLLVAAFARRLKAALETPLSRTQRTVICWLGVGISSVLIHSFADYGLRIPGVAFTFVTVAALFVSVTEVPALATGRSGSRPSKSREP